MIMKTAMVNRRSQLIVVSCVLAVVGALLVFGSVVSAQKTNSSFGQTNKSNAKKRPSRHRRAAATIGRCDPTQQEQTDLSGTYIGKAKHGTEASVDSVLTITGNSFTLTSGSETHTGRITAVTTCGYTAVSLMTGDLTPPTPSPNPPAALPAMSLRAKKVGDKLWLTSVPGEKMSVSFTPTGGAMKSRPRKHRRRTTGNVEAAESVEFPWPPPAASASIRIPFEFLTKPGGSTTVRDVSDRLAQVLNQAGYDEMSWYAVPGGFALVSRFEQCDADGNPLAGAARFILQIFNPPPSGPLDYLKGLVFAHPGHFRVIVFVVSSYPFAQRNVTVTRDEAVDWLNSGTNGLPSGIADNQFTGDYLTTALIYEFEQASADSGAVLKRPSAITGKSHLQRCGIWAALERK